VTRVATRYKEKSSVAFESQPIEATVSGSGIRDNYSRGKVGEFLRQKIQSGSTLFVASFHHLLKLFN